MEAFFLWGYSNRSPGKRRPGACSGCLLSGRPRPARGGRVGDFFSAIIDCSRDVLTNPDTEFPELSGQGYQIVGFGWHQGFNDIINATASAEYKDNIPDLIKDVRTVFGKPNLPFVIASTGMDAGSPQAPPYSGYSPVEKAQLP